MRKELETRIKKLEQRFDILSNQLNKALAYIEDDPHSSLTKSRTILEQILLNIYKLEMNQEPKRIELGAILTDNQFTRKIDRRIVSRMNAIRDMCNLGVHGENVIPKDAKIVLDNLCEVLEWYFDNYRVIKTESEIPEQNLDLKRISNVKRVFLLLGIIVIAICITMFAVYCILRSTKNDGVQVSEKTNQTSESDSLQPSTIINEQPKINDTTNINISSSLSNKNKLLVKENLNSNQEINKVQKTNAELTKVKDELASYVEIAKVIQAKDIVADALNNKGRETMNVEQVDNLSICFTLRENPIAIPGEKTVYLRIIRPDSIPIISNPDNTFDFNGTKISFTEYRQVEYLNQDIEMCFFIDNTVDLIPGNYNVELYLDGNIIGESFFMLSKR